MRTFGGVPKVDALVTDQGDFNIPRASEAEIYDLIISDLAMPEEDGYSLIRKVRTLYKSPAALPAAAPVICAPAETTIALGA